MNYHSDPAIDRAIAAAIRTHPYYAPALTGRLRIVKDTRVPTMATSADWVTHYNPDTLATWTDTEAGAVLVHELEHLLRKHAERCGTREHDRFNEAADAEINQRLDGLPAGCVYPETLGMPRGGVAETYYANARGGTKKPETGDGSGDGAPARCGSAAGGPTQEHEQDDAANPGAGAADGGRTARIEAAEQVMSGMHAGTGDGTDIREWAETQLGIDRAAWYRALATTVGHSLANTGAPTAYRWPGRRDPRDVGGAMIPRWVSERPSCAVVLDTSGSVTPDDLNMARAAAHYIGRIADVVYWTCSTIPVRHGASLPERVRGMGGTDMAAAIMAAVADGARAVVVITDCVTSWTHDDNGNVLTEQPVPIIIGANIGARAAFKPGLGDYYHPPEWMTTLPVTGEPLD